MEQYQKQRYYCEKTAVINGKDIPYAAISEDFLLTDNEGKQEATVFMYTYERKGVTNKNNRPVLFAYNGGPGAASTFTHLGVLGPEVIKTGAGVDMSPTGPFELMDNEDCLLDICDIVLIDPVGTGYARVLNPELAKKYAGSYNDAVATAKAIRQWLTLYDRWASPVFLMGESYGSARSALLSETLYISDDQNGITGLNLNGLIMTGTSLNFGLEPFPIHQSVFLLPTLAAIYWYHHREGKPPLEEFVRQAYDFSYDEYLGALALGNRMPEQERMKTAEKLSGFTGIDKNELYHKNLVVKYDEYAAAWVKREGKITGGYDGRFSRQAAMAEGGKEAYEQDISFSIIQGAFARCFNGVWKEKFNVDSKQEYVLLNKDMYFSWDYKVDTPPCKCLEKAMHRNPRMKLMIASGYYDIYTTVGYARYVMSQFDYPKDRVSMKYYEAGHMLYVGEQTMKQLGKDLREFILWGLE